MRVVKGGNKKSKRIVLEGPNVKAKVSKREVKSILSARRKGHVSIGVWLSVSNSESTKSMLFWTKAGKGDLMLTSFPSTRYIYSLDFTLSIIVLRVFTWTTPNFGHPQRFSSQLYKLFESTKKLETSNYGSRYHWNVTNKKLHHFVLGARSRINFFYHHFSAVQPWNIGGCDVSKHCEASTRFLSRSFHQLHKLHASVYGDCKSDTYCEGHSNIEQLQNNTPKRAPLFLSHAYFLWYSCL